MLKIHAVLIFILLAASGTIAAPVPQDYDALELVASLCGKIVHVERIPDKKTPILYSEQYRPVKDAMLLAYERHGSADCCDASAVTAKTAPNKSGTFAFKGLPAGYYWFVAIVDQKKYTIPVVIKHTQDKQAVCSQMTYTIDESGKFDLRVRAPGR